LPENGLFVTFEGVEGSGKSSRTLALARALEERGEEVLHTREPGGPPVAEQVRDLLLDRRQEVPPLTELFLYLASRSANVSLKVAPALERGCVVLCERYSDATMAYQVGGRGLPREPVDRANELATGGLVPHLTILLDLDPETGLLRLKASGRGRDRIEAETLEFHSRVRQAYLDLATRESDRYLVLDAATCEREQDSLILDAVLKALERRRNHRSDDLEEERETIS
jgi:dTMP kinase